MKYLFYIFAILTVDQSWAKSKTPVIYVHGVGAPYQIFESFNYMKKIFNEEGHSLFIARTPTISSIEESAEILFTEINKYVPDGPYHLIGHSMGGLIVRAAINKYGLHSRCKSLTLISVPNRGSYVADWAIARYEANFQHPILKKIINQFSGEISVVNELTSSNIINNFNPKNDILNKLPIFSIGYYIPKPVYLYSHNPYLLLTHSINSMMGDAENDGMVSTRSAKWGTYLGSFPGDHYATQGPIPFGGEFIYYKSFKRIIDNWKNI